jgi:hypothetical protein
MAETIVVVRMGQSNSFGAAANSSIDSSFKQTFTSIKTWTGAAFASLNYAVNNNQYPAPLTDLSASEYAILTGIQGYYGGTIYDIKYAVPDTYLGTNFSPSTNWNVNTRASYLDSACSTITDAMLNLWNQGFRSFKVFVFWDQGEGDSKNSTDANNYQTNFQSLVNRLQKSFGTCSKVYIINPTVNSNLIQTAAKTTITAATNASPIVITTSAAHLLSTGDHVEITEVLGNTAANGSDWTITVVDSTRFSLNSSTGNGTYTSGGYASQFVFRSTVISAQNTVTAATPNCYSYDTSSYTRDSGGVHYTAQGFKDKGDYAVNSIIIANNL